MEFSKFILIYRMAFEFKFRKKWYVPVGDFLLILLAGGYYGCLQNNEVISMCVYAVLVGGFSLITFCKVGEWYRGVGQDLRHR